MCPGGPLYAVITPVRLGPWALLTRRSHPVAGPVSALFVAAALFPVIPRFRQSGHTIVLPRLGGQSRDIQAQTYYIKAPEMPCVGTHVLTPTTPCVAGVWAK